MRDRGALGSRFRAFRLRYRFFGYDNATQEDYKCRLDDDSLAKLEFDSMQIPFSDTVHDDSLSGFVFERRLHVEALRYSYSISVQP